MKHRVPHVLQMFDVMCAHASKDIDRPWSTVEECQLKQARKSIEALLKAVKPLAAQGSHGALAASEDAKAQRIAIRQADLQALRKALIDARGFV